MRAPDFDAAGRGRPATLGALAESQLRLLGDIVGLPRGDTEAYANVLVESLGNAAQRSLALPPPSRSFLSDDHTPFEFSLSCQPGKVPSLRLLFEPGCAADNLFENGRTGWHVLHRLAQRWGFGVQQLDLLEDLFLPPSPQGSLALWCALELCPGGVPRLKVYLNPAASGAHTAGATVREALRRLGYDQGLAALPPGDGYPFFALDLGNWDAPRAKVYLRHENLTAAGAALLSRMQDGPPPAVVEQFFRTAAGSPAPTPEQSESRAELCLDQLPALTCHSFTETTTGLPSGFTLHIPIRAYVQHDGEARTRAVAALNQHGIDATPLTRALSAVTSRQLAAGPGLIAYLALVHEHRQAPRVTAYISAEAYTFPSATPLPPSQAAPSPMTLASQHNRCGATDKDRSTTTVEPYRIKVVEPIPITTRDQREQALQRVHYSLFDLRAEEVTIDLLSDSGTGALSAAQLAAAMEGDESYAGSRSFYKFRDTVAELTGFQHILPVHQGRAAERILFSTLLSPGSVVLSNTHFDTTRANVELAGCEARNLPCPEAADLDSKEPFKGNIDLDALQRELDATGGAPVAAVVMTITNNGGGGQPVSMRNLKDTASLCRRYDVPLILDAARFAENAWLVTQHEESYRDRTPRQVAEEAFRLADGCVMSAKKDGIVHIGGFVALNDTELAQKCQNLLIATEGFPTYGGLAGRDLAMIAQGLWEVTEPAYLEERADIARYFADQIRAAGVDILEPPGLHALYLNAGRLLPHIPPHRYPGHALACQLYLEGGIRSAELGSLYLGEEDEEGNPIKSAPYELVRLALPRRVYTRSHYDHVAATLHRIATNPESVQGFRIVKQSPILRHFSIELARA
ncbi:tryptophanase [Streptomyces sp. NBC_00285]|uniref:tryptophanase n=1 Tax=Streptomyces sp. NBC_00285 TaxID=2975700 RepID=UPI002E2C0FAF|nr:tryptophanase [Streptomyces sp. NBC_00285]